jgi:DNA mismatch endonuclease, patch repair protein
MPSMSRSPAKPSGPKREVRRLGVDRPLRLLAPSFKGLKPASEASSRSMQGNTSTHTKPEKLLQRELRSRGLRYRTHSPELPGRPDLVFSAHRTVVFCDGDFWHGKNWRLLKQQLARRFNADYWIAKIERNRRRDRSQVTALKNQGWRVLRYWESDIRRSPQAIADQLQETLAAYAAETPCPGESTR